MNDISAAESASPTRVALYVEDQPVNVLLMQAIFSRRPEFELMIATDGASGLRAAHTCKPDLLLLDIGLPDCRGDELLQQMRALPGWMAVPAVAVTADHAFELAGTSFDALWTKPLHVQQTLERLDLCLAEPSDSAPSPAARHDDGAARGGSAGAA